MIIFILLLLAIFGYFVFKIDKTSKIFEYKNKLYDIQSDLSYNAEKKYKTIPTHLLTNLLNDSYRALKIINSKKSIFFIILENKKVNHYKIIENDKLLAVELNLLNAKDRENYLIIEKRIHDITHSYFKNHSIIGRFFDKLKYCKNKKVNHYCLEIDNTINNLIKTYHV